MILSEYLEQHAEFADYAPLVLSMLMKQLGVSATTPVIEITPTPIALTPVIEHPTGTTLDFQRIGLYIGGAVHKVRLAYDVQGDRLFWLQRRESDPLIIPLDDGDDTA